MKLDNGIIAVEFDERTGSLVQLLELKDGFKHLADPEGGRLFRVVVPDDGRWLDRHCESHLSGRPSMCLDGDKAIIHYPDLRVARTDEKSAISATVTVSLPQGAEEALFTIEIRNGGPHMIHEVWFPRVGGWRGYAGPGKDTILRGDLWNTDPHSFRKTVRPNGYTLADHHRREYASFAFGMPFPFLDISGGRHGMSYIHYPAKIRAGGALLEDLSEMRGEHRPAWSWVHQPFIRPGESWTSDPVGIAPHKGDWHATADRMRAWLGTWWTPPEYSSRLRESIGYFNLYARDFMGLEITPLKQLVKVAKELKKHGINDFCVWDMAMAIYLRPDTGDFLMDDPNRLDEFRRALREIRRMGIQVSTLVNYRLTTAKNRSWKTRGERQVMRSLYGAPRYEHWSKCRGAFGDFLQTHLDEGGASLCQNHPAFQRWAVALTGRMLDFGFSSVFIDQPFETSVCFAQDHGHSVPAHGHEGVGEWVPKAVAEIRRRDPEGYAIGENADIWTSRHIQLWWDWQWAGKRADVFRYILPDSLQSWIIDAHEHQHEIGKAFALGFLLSLNVRGLERPISAMPEFAARIRRLAALRRKTAAFTVHGRFLGDNSLKIKTKAKLAACVFDAGDKLGIILGECADGKKGGGKVDMSVDLSALGRRTPAKLLMHREDGSVSILKPSVRGRILDVAFRLRRWESAVIEIPLK